MQLEQVQRRYHLLELVGKGSYGDVWLAKLESNGFSRRVALKVLNARTSRMAFARDQIRHEAILLGRLAHRNIVAALDLVELEEGWAIVMDWIPGADLAQLLARVSGGGRAIPGPAAMEIGAAVASALEAAHTATDDEGRPLGVVHRDINPGNVRVTRDGDVKVLDFGVALGLDVPDALRSPRIGTEPYLSPERRLGVEDSFPGDVYALGATVVELLVGHPLGSLEVESYHLQLGAALREVRAALYGPAHEVDQVLDTLRGCLARDPAARPLAGELVERFEHHARAVDGPDLRTFCRAEVPSNDQRVLTPTPLPERFSSSEPAGLTLVPEEPPTPLHSKDHWVSLHWERPSVLYAAEPPPIPAPEVIELPRAPPRYGRGLTLSPLWTVAVVGTMSWSFACGLLPVAGLAWVLRLSPGARMPAPAPTPRAIPALAPASGSSADLAFEAEPVIAVEGADAIVVRCGGQVWNGSSPLRLPSSAAGTCSVEATGGGKHVEAWLRVERGARLNCAIAGDELRCGS